MNFRHKLLKNWMLDIITRLSPNMLSCRKWDTEITISPCALSKPDSVDNKGGWGRRSKWGSHGKVEGEKQREGKNISTRTRRIINHTACMHHCMRTKAKRTQQSLNRILHSEKTAPSLQEAKQGNDLSPSIVPALRKQSMIMETLF